MSGFPCLFSPIACEDVATLALALGREAVGALADELDRRPGEIRRNGAAVEAGNEL